SSTKPSPAWWSSSKSKARPPWGARSSGVLEDFVLENRVRLAPRSALSLPTQELAAAHHEAGDEGSRGEPSQGLSVARAVVAAAAAGLALDGRRRATRVVFVGFVLRGFVGGLGRLLWLRLLLR